MNIPTPSSIRQLMPSACIDADSTDIVLFNSKPSLHVSTIMQNALGYPEGCTFYFSGYDGIENADKLKTKENGKNKDGSLIMMIVFFSYSNYLLSYLLRVFSCTYFHTCDILAHIFSYHTRAIFLKN